ncbi:MAG: cation diffusion facilitator family transporter [Methanomassiliicoccaceae archaeon]|jgi:cation diffusion facilitator family transporter|nr:cation diffusion facilitator family transporter [Methanomassiliicoccaceae archaeon]
MNGAVSSAAMDNYRFQRYIVALSGIVLIVKFLAWLITGSVAIFTDALESIVNVAAGVIGLYALYLSTKPRDFDHPYGHGRAEFISATVEGAMISIAGVMIIMEAVRNILDPNEIPNLHIGMLLILTTAVANYTVGAFAIRKGKNNRSPALVASGKHIQSDAYSSFGIILGLTVLVVVTSMGYAYYWIDGAIALVFGGIILTTGVFVVKRSMEGIMDKVDVQLLTDIVKTLSDNRRDKWIDIHDLKMVKYGSTIHIDMHVTMPWYISVKDQRDEICMIISLIREKYGECADLSITCDPCQEFSCVFCKHECNERKKEFTGLLEWNIKNLSENSQHGKVCENANE